MLEQICFLKICFCNLPKISIQKLGAPAQTMTAIFHTSLYEKFIKIKSNFSRKNLHRMNRDSNFLGANFSNGNNVKPQSNLEAKDSPSISKDDPSIFTSSTKVTRLIKQNKLSFSSIEINTPLPAPKLQCLVAQIRVQNLTLVVATNQA